jgi:hypothetical protein
MFDDEKDARAMVRRLLETGGDGWRDLAAQARNDGRTSGRPRNYGVRSVSLRSEGTAEVGTDGGG